MLKGLYILNEGAFNKIYSEEDKKKIEKHVDIYAPPQLWDNTKDSNWLKRENPEVLHDLEVIFSGWGAPVMDKEFLDAVPNLKMVFYGAGSIKGIVTDEFWDRDIRITSAYAANAVPVAEYTLSQILFCLKHGWFFALHTERNGEFPDYNEKNKIPGAYGTIVGIISLGMIGSYVCELLKSFDVNVIAYDPYCSEEKAVKLGVELCSLDDVFRRSNVVSLHTPWLKETEGMIKGKHFEMMKCLTEEQINSCKSIFRMKQLSIHYSSREFNL
jgi:phosphoglycerate dehydrogenase-like enzyme